jgi:hypothetical protein
LTEIHVLAQTVHIYTGLRVVYLSCVTHGCYW